MKIYGFPSFGLLGLLVSMLSIGSSANGQIISDSISPVCQNCVQAVNFSSAAISPSSIVVDGAQVSNQVFYQDIVTTPATAVDASIAPVTYAAPLSTSIATNISTATSAAYVAPIATSAAPIATVAQPAISAVATSPASFATGNAGSGLAQSKAQQAASRGLRGHLGGGLGNAKYEGVGWSNQSAQSAIQSCCYWGTRPVSEIGVALGSDGLWYACVLYN